MVRSNKSAFFIKLAIICALFFGFYPIFHTENASAIDPKKELIQSENNIIFLDTCNGESNTEESCASASGNNITWIGDSYSVGAKDQILEKFSGVDIGSDSDPYIHCSKHIAMGDNDTDMDTCSRAGLSGLDLAKKIKDAGKMRPFLVFALATNDPGSDKGSYIKHFEELLTTVGSDTHIILVTTKTPDGSDYSGVNDAMRDTASKYSNVSVADWANSDKWKAEFFGDGVHPFNGGGIDAWLSVIQEAMPSDCADSGSVKALQDKVLELAWPENTHGTDKKPEYAAVVQQYENGEKKDSDGTPYSYVGGCSGVDCGAWVSILMRESGWDPDYNSGGGPTAHQLQYLQNSDKWESLNAIGTSIPEDQLKPGDVAVNDGHTYAYVGEIAGFGSHIASASLCGRAPTAGGEAPGDGSYYWFRKKGSGDNGQSSSSSSSSNSSSNSSSTSSSIFSAENFLKSSNNKIYDGSREIWTEEEAKKIEEYYPIYKRAADDVGVPWALIAVAHRLESGMTRTNPDSSGVGCAAQGLYGDFYGCGNPLYQVGLETDDENFYQQSKIAAQGFKDANPGLSESSDDGVIKKAFFAYNGQASVYIQQAKNLGFSDEEARNGEGSPYVMNYADEKRDPEKNGSNWGQIKTDGGAISYPANTSFVGAFLMYAALAGFSPSPAGSNDQCCDNPKKTQTNTGNFTKYTDMTDDQLMDLLDVATHENGGSLNAVKTELSVMANLFEKNGGDRPKNATGFCDYIKTGGWFAGANAAMIGDGRHDDHPSEYVEAAIDIFINGNRTLPVEVDEHDWVGDLSSVTNDGREIDKNDPSQYKRGVTIIKNIYGSTYTFWAFADDEAKTGDPFGYIDGDPQEITSAPTNNTTTGNNSVECCDGDNTSTEVSGDRKTVVDKAKSMIGQSYYTVGNPVYNMSVEEAKNYNGEGGFDCNSFVRWAWLQVGVELPGPSGHYGYGQWNFAQESGRPLKKTIEELLPGDEIFYFDPGGTMCHVAIYIGDGKIAESATDAVNENTVDGANYYHGGWIGWSPIDDNGSSSSKQTSSGSSCPDESTTIGPNGLTEEQAAKFLAHYSQNYKDVTYNFFSNAGDSRFSGGWNGGGSVAGCSIEDQCSGLSTFFIDTFTKNGKIGYTGSGNIHGLLDAKGVQQIPGPEVFSVFDSVSPSHTGLVVGKTDDGKFIYIHLNGTKCNNNGAPLNDIPEPASNDIKVDDYMNNWSGASTHPGLITYDDTGISTPVVYYKLDVDKEALAKFIGES